MAKHVLDAPNNVYVVRLLKKEGEYIDYHHNNMQEALRRALALGRLHSSRLVITGKLMIVDARSYYED